MDNLELLIIKYSERINDGMCEDIDCKQCMFNEDCDVYNDMLEELEQFK